MRGERSGSFGRVGKGSLGGPEQLMGVLQNIHEIGLKKHVATDWGG